MQQRVTAEIVAWYLKTYFRTPQDPGTLAMFCSAERLGDFALKPTALRRGDGKALFQLLVGTVLFQRQRDLQVMSILRGLSKTDIEDLTDVPQLLGRALEHSCGHAHRTTTLHSECDLRKDAKGHGVCSRPASGRCHLKRHAELLRRYGDFGKMPTSAALLLHEGGQPSLSALFHHVCRTHQTKLGRAVALEAQLLRVWRVSHKIANMYLSVLANPDLNPGGPWWGKLDWTYFVVVDSNVEQFFESVQLQTPSDYKARREFIQALARTIDLRLFRRDLHAYNPRLVQQALYVFMSASNRRESSTDCSKNSPPTCADCARQLSSRCQVRPQ
jgi:hypothetical protein